MYNYVVCLYVFTILSSQVREMSTITVYLLLSLSVLCTIIGQGQSCLDGFPSVTDNTCTSSSCPFQGLPNPRQLRLFPSMRITCNGMLVGLSVAGETRNGGDYSNLQIWRPTGSTSNDYERISEYTFPIGCTQTNNVWQCTISSSIDVEVGDIIGINLSRNSNSQSAFGIYFTSPSSYTSYILDSTSASTFSVPGSTTASAQPMLTLDIQEQVTETTTPELTTQASTTQSETEGPTTQPATQAPTTEPTTQAPTPEPTTQTPTPEPTPVPTTQTPTPELTTTQPTPPEDQTTAAGAGQFAGDTEIAGPLVGGVVGVLLLVLIVALVVGLVVYILTRRRFTNKWTPEVVSERQLAEGSQRGVISNGIQSAETDYEVIELDSPRQPTETITQNPSYMPNTDASINYEGEMYSYIDPEDVRILARNPIVSQDEIKTEQVATSSNIATADNICYGSAIPRADHSDQVPTFDNVAYGSTVR